MKIEPAPANKNKHVEEDKMSQQKSGDNSLADQARLEKIDKLTELGIGEYVALPQLVVVGDQSSGKSSVLEGLTELPFPRDSSLCTRFATRIVFRRGQQEKTVISIIPHASSGDGRSEKLRSFQVDVPSLNAETFKDILARACEAMDIPGPGEAPIDGQPAFSEDILNIEMTGPKRSHLSVIDVPGIFRSPNPPLTTSSDMAMVRRMVHDFIKDSRTIMLAVLPANVDIATQEILELAGEVDPNGDRTLGVLTKPDLVEAGTERDVIELVDGKRKPLKLGYCVVRNRKQNEKDATPAERHRNEQAYFDSGPFSMLSKDRVGMRALEGRLQALLRQITRNTFPNVRKEIDKKLGACSDELKALGPSRQTEEEQRKYLMNICLRYQEGVSCAIDAQYARNDYLRGDGSIRLATRLVDINTEYAAMMTFHGQYAKFVEGNLNEESGSDHECPDRDIVESELSENMEAHGIDSLIDLDISGVKGSYSEILDWLEAEYLNSRGFELGTFNPSILPNIFKEFTQNWEPITWWYLSKVIRTVHDFSHELLEHYVHDDRVLSSLWELLLEEFRAKYQAVQGKLRSLLDIERSGTLLTTNHYFAQNLQKAERKRMEVRLKKHSAQNPNDKNVATINTLGFLDDLNLSNEEYTVRSIHDVLEAYYKVALKRFVDYVCLHGIDHHLVSGPDALLRHFNSNYVLQLTASKLAAVAGEDFITVERRSALTKQIESLRKAKKVLIG